MPAMGVKNPRKILRRGFSVDSGMISNDAFNSTTTVSNGGCGGCVRRDGRFKGPERRTSSWTQSAGTKIETSFATATPSTITTSSSNIAIKPLVFEKPRGLAERRINSYIYKVRQLLQYRTHAY